MLRVTTTDRMATALLWGIGGAVVALLVAIVGHFLVASAGTLSLSFLVSNPSDSAVGGVGPILFNSLYVLGLTLLITVPLGILAGVYMAEYAPDSPLTSLIRFCQELTSSVPSIVVGMFGLALFVSATGWGYTAFAGALALTVFNLPLLSRVTEQAIRGVPAEARAGSLALGATTWQTIRHVVLPIAIPGMVTGVVLTAGRIFGEAAALLFTAGLATPIAYDFANLNVADPRSPWSPFHPATTLSVYIWKLNSEGLGEFIRQIADASAALLVLMVLAFNLAARGLGRLLQRRATGG